MKIAVLTTDNRGPFRQFEKTAPWFGTAPEALLSGLALVPELEVHVISCIRQPVSSPAQLAPNIWFHSLHVPKIGWLRTGYSGCIRAVRRRLKQIGPDLVHGQGSELEAAMCAAYSGYPNVITLLGIMAEMKKVCRARIGSFFWAASILEGLSLRKTAGVFCNSRYVQEAVRDRARKTWVVPNAVRQVFFETPTPTRRAPKCVLLNVGTICSYKQQNELIDAAEQWHQQGLDFEIHFIGHAYPGDPYAAEFLQRVRTRPYLVHRGFMSVAELISEYDSAAALVHVSAIETFGLVIAEALSRNLKFFGVASGGALDIASGMEAAELFPDKDWAAIGASVAKWIRNGFPRPTTTARVIRERYHPAEIARQHMAIYREVLAGSIES